MSTLTSRSYRLSGANISGRSERRVCDLAMKRMRKMAGDGAEIDGFNVEDHVEKTPIDEETIRTVRGSEAPGAMSFDRRIQVMDLQGVRRQLLFPFFGMFAPLFESTPIEKIGGSFGIDNVTPPKIRRLAQGVQKAYNGWAAEMTRKHFDRIRPAGVLLANDLDQLLRDTEEIIASGLSSVIVPASLPPGGKSPADEALDPFWSMCAGGRRSGDDPHRRRTCVSTVRRVGQDPRVQACPDGDERDPPGSVHAVDGPPASGELRDGDRAWRRVRTPPDPAVRPDRAGRPLDRSTGGVA